MKDSDALLALGALAQETRLAVFRLLVREGPRGLPAGDIARGLNVPPATLSFHLKELDRAGLISARRESRQIYYAVDAKIMRGLIDFLLNDCCGGHPDIRLPERRRRKAAV